MQVRRHSVSVCEQRSESASGHEHDAFLPSTGWVRSSRELVKSYALLKVNTSAELKRRQRVMREETIRGENRRYVPEAPRANYREPHNKGGKRGLHVWWQGKCVIM